MEIIPVLLVSLLATSTFAAVEQNDKHLKQNTLDDQHQSTTETNNLVTGQVQEVKQSTASNIETHIEASTNKIVSDAEQEANKAISDTEKGIISSDTGEERVPNGAEQLNPNSDQISTNSNPEVPSTDDKTMKPNEDNSDSHVDTSHNDIISSTEQSGMSVEPVDLNDIFPNQPSPIVEHSDNIHDKIILNEEKKITSTDEVVSNTVQTSTDTVKLTSNAEHESSSSTQVISEVEKPALRVLPQPKFGGWSSYTTKCAIANREPKVWQRIQLLLLCEKRVKSSLPLVPRTEIPIEEIMGISDKLEDDKSIKTLMILDYLKKLPPVTGSFVEFLYRNLAVPRRDQVNTAVAPLSLRVGLAALGMAAVSFTQQEIFRVLKVNEHSLLPRYIAEIGQLNLKGWTSVQMVSKFYVDKSFFPVNDKFKNDLDRVFETDVEQANFRLGASSEIERINQVVAERTDGRITDAVRADDISPDTSLLFVNTVFFKGEWEIHFNKQMGFNGDFLLPNKRRVKATYMTRPAAYGYYKEVKKDSYRMLELPFLKTETSGPYSMIIILPDEINGLAQVEKYLTEDDGWLREFDLQSTKHTAVVKPTIPRFTIDTRVDLQSSLAKMGVTLMFEHSPDFQGITNSTQESKLELKELHQRVFIRVDERGTNAPPPNGPHIPEVRAIKPNPINFNANHPFAFALINRDTKTVLFMGHVVKPVFDNLFGVKATAG